LLKSLTYFVVHSVEDVWHGRDHRGLEQPDVVVEESHVAGIKTDRTAGKQNGNLERYNSLVTNQMKCLLVLQLCEQMVPAYC
jgi:hypothetical protein